MPESTTNGPEGAAFIAVKRCCEAWNRALEAAKAQKLDNFDSRQAANAAYLAAMPFLCGEDNIRGFIACIAQGMILEVFYDKLGTQLVYVAHTALRALPREHRPVGRPRKSSNPPQPDPESESDSGTPASQVQNNPAPIPPDPVQSNPDQSNPDQSVVPTIHACVPDLEPDPDQQEINYPYPYLSSKIGRPCTITGAKCGNRAPCYCSRSSSSAQSDASPNVSSMTSAVKPKESASSSQRAKSPCSWLSSQ